MLDLQHRSENDPMLLYSRINDNLAETFEQRGQTLPEGQIDALHSIVHSLLEFQMGKASVVPILPGGGKSTVIRVYLGVVAGEFARASPIAETLGGVVVVVETIAEAHELADLCNEQGEHIALVVEAPSNSNVKSGCVSGIATEASECIREDCPDFQRCPIISSKKRMNETPILIITHARFRFFMEDYEPLLTWTQDGVIRRRNLLLVDENPQLIDPGIINLRQLTKLGQELTDPLKFRKGEYLYEQWQYKIVFPFLRLMKTMGKEPGITSISPADNREELFPGLEQLEETLTKGAIRPWHLNAFRMVFDTLLRGSSAFVSNIEAGAPSLLCPKIHSLSGENKPATFIFSGTANLLPELRENKDVHYLRDAEYMPDYSRLTLHIQRDPAIRFSKSASETLKNYAGILGWVNECLSESRKRHSKAMVVSYKSLAPRLWDDLKGRYDDFIVPHTDRDGKASNRVPYFGGTTGSNAYADCTAMVSAGLNRFSSQDYLARALAMVRVAFRWEVIYQSADRKVSEPIAQMEAYLLANDLVQAIFRTDLRNHSSEKPIDVYLFDPPPLVEKLLRRSFPGCQVESLDALSPACILAACQEKSYGGKTPHFVALLTALMNVPAGKTVKPKEIRLAAGLSSPEFKEAQRNSVVKGYLTEHFRIEGKGAGTTYHKV